MSRHQTANKIQLALPTNFYISVLKSTGQYSQEYPTFTLSYLGSYDIPDEDVLGDIQAFSTEFMPEEGQDLTNLTIMAFLIPKKELLDFSDSLYLNVPVPTKETNQIFHKIQELGRYVVIINTETYCYRALVDDDSGEVLEASVEYRFLN